MTITFFIRCFFWVKPDAPELRKFGGVRLRRESHGQALALWGVWAVW
ncbi:MAG: hypothetical protein N2644_03840 [Candidatus Sumerlaea chitinivorans]|uniref:Uncharacterized protein n=1 Tax=Sumerlaea chitinivorans TaxID=2250252 RepID=A0A2Z4Y7I9_SUMC1|nr:hypothetical protein BRCON_2447 [Candidatus Sumerlaea chitinivorans]MCX7963603.1 hypothetical protein [Candidatus Sumerlaea chitinivorans]